MPFQRDPAAFAEPGTTAPPPSGAAESAPDGKADGATVTPSPSLVTDPNPAVSTTPAPVSPTAPAPAEAGKASAKTVAKPKGDATADEDAEVINNILGVPLLPTQAPSEDAMKPVSMTAPRVQRHVSFLDGGESAAVSSDFDYGVYALNLRLLETYRQRVKEAVETARQLSIPASTEAVDTLLREAQTHKRRFESLYPSPKPEESRQGLAEWEQARRSLLRALALVTASPAVEGRAIWLDRESIVRAANPDGLRALLQRLNRAGINIIYFETLNAGFPVYPSKILAHNPLIRDWDPLAVAVEEGHRLGMEVHAWVWCFAVGNRRHNPLIGKPENYPGPILAEGRLADEALRNRGNGLNVDGRQNEFWLSPASPKARAFLMDVYKEIVSGYAVDGIHLDYIRYPFQTAGTRMGYEPAGRTGFQQTTGRSLDNPDAETLRLWTAWKTAQVNHFVREISETLRPLRPGLKISAAVFPMRRAARIAAIQQDWETWINNGWVDILNPMSYTTSPERLQSLFESVRTATQRHSPIYPGVALSRLDDGQLVLHLEALREKGSLGATLFAGIHLDADKEETLANGPFKQHQSLPPHRNIVQSLVAVVAEYQQTFERVLAASTPTAAIPAERAQEIRRALEALSASLASVKTDSGKATDAEKTTKPVGPTRLSSERLQELRQCYDTLQAATQAWLADDRALKPLRARYFEHHLYLLSELLAYLHDQSTAAVH
jgi:uncharacterized lipoprotein YddW (UPF0748 family)